MSVCKGAAILWYSKIGRQREAHAAMGLAGRSDEGRGQADAVEGDIVSANLFIWLNRTLQVISGSDAVKS